jgi:AcrR family transcriptional regulator
MRPESPGTVGEVNTRVARTHAAVMDAAIELLLEGGPDALTVDGVVARSGVAKSTVYRHWTTRDDLVADVFEHMAPNLQAPDPSLEFDVALRQLVGSLAAIMSDERWRRVLPALLMLKQHRGDVAAIEERISNEQLNVCSCILQRGIAEGHLDPSLDEQTLMALLTGPVLMAGLTGAAPLDQKFVDGVVDHFLAGARPRVAP